MNEKWSELSVKEIEKKYNTNAVLGLTRKAARSRFRKKENGFYLSPSASVWQGLRQVVSDPIMLMLALTALISASFDKTGLAITLFVLLSVTGLLVTVSYLVSRRILVSMPEHAKPWMKVIREGKLYLVPAERVVRGDVVLLRAGDILPFDARILSCERFSVSTYLGKDDEGRDRYEKQDKSAERGEEDLAHPLSAENMVYAGSHVRRGEARVLVVEIGLYTYIGALCGGVSFLPPAKPLRALEYVKQFNARYSLLSLIAVFPVTVLAFVGAGSELGLFEAFLVALCLAVSSMGTYLNAFSDILVATALTRCALTSVSGGNAAIVKSVDQLDTLARTDHLFLFEPCALTDGRWHTESVYTARSLLIDLKHPAAVALLEWGYLFFSAMLATPSGSNAYSLSFGEGFYESLARSGVDVGRLMIAYPSKHFEPEGYRGLFPTVRVSGSMGERVIVAADDGELLSHCTTLRTPGGIEKLAGSEAEQLRYMWQEYVSRGAQVITLATVESGGLCFEGFLSYTEVYLPTLTDELSLLKRAGVACSLFCEEESPRMAGALLRCRWVNAPDEIAYASEFRRAERSLADSLGQYRVYLGFSPREIAELIRAARESRRRVVSLGRRNAELPLLRLSDVCLVCDATEYRAGGTEEIPLAASAEEGTRTSSRCSSLLKRHADALIRRPDGREGGLRAFVHLMATARTVYLNLLNLFTYLVTAMVVRSCVVLPPLFFGQSLIAPAPLLICGMVFDFAAVAICAFDKAEHAVVMDGSMQLRYDFSHLLTRRPEILGGGIAAALSAWLLPLLLCAFGVFESMAIGRSYAFLSLLLIQMTLLYLIRLNLYRSPTSIRFNVINLSALGAVFLFSVLAVAIPSFGASVGVGEIGLVAILLLPVGPALTLLGYSVIVRMAKKRES